MRRKELFYYLTSGSNVMRDMHWCVTVFYQKIENGNMANQIHGFTIDYGKFITSDSRLLASGSTTHQKTIFISGPSDEILHIS